MRRCALLLLTLCLAAPAAADAATGRFFPGESADTDTLRVEDVALSRDGTGAVAYLRTDGLHVQRWVNGQSAGTERVDGGTAVTSAAVAAGDGGRLVVVFAGPSGVFSVHRPSASAGYLPAQQLSAAGSDPSVGMSVGGHAYAVWRSGGDLRAAHMERRQQAFTGLPDALDVRVERNAGDTGRPVVGTSADGTGLAVWGEGGAVVARRLYGESVSGAPQVLTEQGSDPDVGVEDDSSYAWAVFRTPSGTLARRQRGVLFDEPFAVGDVNGRPRIAVSGRGEGYAVTGGQGGALSAVLKDDKFNPPAVLGAAAGGGRPVAAVAESGDGAVAWFGPDGSVRARSYDNNQRSRLATVPNPEVTLSDPSMGATDTAAGLEAGGNRAGDALFAWVQVTPDGVRRLALGTFDRFPGAFRGTSTTGWRSARRPPLRWLESFELWGALTYQVLIDGQPVGTSATRELVPAVDVADGLHTWQVLATDRRGQVQRSPVRNLRVDATPPVLDLRVKRRKGGRTEVDPRVTDDPGTGVKASGIEVVRVQFGRARALTLVKPPFKVVRAFKKGTVRVSVTDRAGNVVTATARVGGGG